MKDLPLDISTWDERCMEEFIRQNSVLFHAFASRYVDDPGLIDDFLQEAYIKLWTHRRDIGRVSSLNNYFFAILRNTILDKWAWLSRRDASVDDDAYLNLSSNETFLAHIIEAESSHLIAEAVAKLSPQSRQVITLLAQGKSMPEIADALGVSLNTVRTVKYRALERLSTLLSREDFLLLLLLVWEV